MSSLTDPKGIQATVNAIYEGGREHPLADLARLIDGAIRDAEFQGLADFDIARWVAHTVTEDMKAQVPYITTAPHGQFVPNPPKPTYEGVSRFPASTETRTAEQFLIDQVPDAGEYPHVEWNDSRPVTVSYRQGPGLWDFLKDLPATPKLPTVPDFPKLDLSGIQGMPVDIKESLEAAAEQMRESMERAAKAVRKGIDEARAAEARRILAETEHEHIYGRGSNGLCRICGHESNNRRARAKRREIHNTKAKAARQYPQHAVGEQVENVAALAHGMTQKGRVLAPADHDGMVQVGWDGGARGRVHVHDLSAPESQLYEALKEKGDGGE